MLKQQAIKAKYHFALGALVISNGRVVGAGYNRAYHNGSNGTTDCAEILALKKAPKSRRANADVIVLRVKKSGTYGIAKPCAKCEKALRKAGIKRVYYTCEEGWREMRL